MKIYGLHTGSALKQLLISKPNIYFVFKNRTLMVDIELMEWSAGVISQSTPVHYVYRDSYPGLVMGFFPFSKNCNTKG